MKDLRDQNWCLTPTKYMGIISSVCYSNSPISVILLKSPLNKYHKHVVLIQSIKYIFYEKTMFRVLHPLHERNQSVDFMDKLKISTNVNLLIHDSPTLGLSNILAPDVA